MAGFDPLRTLAASPRMRHDPPMVTCNGLNRFAWLPAGCSSRTNADVRLFLRSTNTVGQSAQRHARVGGLHGLELHGGVEKRSDGIRNLNVYLARGYSYWWGDDLDLWVTSNPHVEGQTFLGGISKKPWSKADLQMAHELLAAFALLQCSAKS